MFFSLTSDHESIKIGWGPREMASDSNYCRYFNWRNRVCEAISIYQIAHYVYSAGFTHFAIEKIVIFKPFCWSFRFRSLAVSSRPDSTLPQGSKRSVSHQEKESESYGDYKVDPTVLVTYSKYCQGFVMFIPLSLTSAHLQNESKNLKIIKNCCGYQHFK